MNNKRRIRLQNIELIIGLALILGFLGIALAAPVLAPPTGDFPELTYIIPRDGYKDYPLPPNSDHPLGTLPDQYDIYYGLVWGTRRAFIVGISITLGRAIIGVILGLISGYYKGIFSSLILRITDAFMSMPSIVAAALMFALFGELALPSFSPGGGFSDPTGLLQSENRNVFIIVLSLILFGWMQYARLIRANVISEREKEYVQAAKSVGAPNRRVIFKHILPNGIKGLFVLIASDIGSMVAVVSLFYFIGLIGKYPYGLVADWGQILSESRDWIVGPPNQPFLYWYTYLPAISAIALFTIAWSMVGDGLRDLFDPRNSSRRRKKSSSFTKWFRRSPQIQEPAYPNIRSLKVETLPEETELDPALLYARNALKREDLSEAFHAYTHLVWDKKNIGTVIRDLQAITWKYPSAVEAWSILGEALNQLGREQEAQQVFQYYRKISKEKRFNRKGNGIWNKNLIILGVFILLVGLISIAFVMSKGNLLKEVNPPSNTEPSTEVAAPIPPATPTDTPWGLYLPTPKAAFATRTPTGSSIATVPSTTSTQSQSTVAYPSCLPDHPYQTGKAVEIIDGNTIKVLIGEYVYAVRYIGIDTPVDGDANELFGTQATFKNADLVYRKDITLIPGQSDKDSRGHLLRYVLVGDTFVNNELVAQGLATVLTDSSDIDCAVFFEQTEQQAIENQVGIWTSTSPTSSP